MLLLREVPEPIKTWEEKIDEAEQRGFFTPQEVIELACWDSCLVGEVFEAPRERTACARRLVDWYESIPAEARSLGCESDRLAEKNQFAALRRMLERLRRIRAALEGVSVNGEAAGPSTR